MREVRFISHCREGLVPSCQSRGIEPEYGVTHIAETVMAGEVCPKVLWADDEVYQTNLLADVLRCEGLDVVGAKDATTAKRVLAGQTGEFSLVVVDVMMPPGEEFENLTAVQGGYRSGLLLARWIRSTYPTLPVVGYSLDHSPEVAEWFETEAAG